MANCVAGVFKFGFKCSICERSHVPLHVDCKGARIAKELSPLPNLEKADVRESLCEKDLTEIFQMRRTYRQQFFQVLPKGATRF
jgi:hypothetical protein